MCDNCDYIITTERAKDKIIAGVDEVARGTFIGPVIAACVVLPKDFPDDTFKQIKDSKKLSENKREYLADYIKSVCITYGIGEVSNKEIDEINILNATSAEEKAKENNNDDDSTCIICYETPKEIGLLACVRKYHLLIFDLINLSHILNFFIF
jgi:ribonuclease HII